MKRARTGQACENKETHWIDDALQCILAASFPRLRINGYADAQRLFTLPLVSRQFARLATAWLMPRLRHCASDVFASMHPHWQSRLTGLRAIDLRPALPYISLAPYTQLRRLHTLHFGYTKLPTSLRELTISYQGWAPTLTLDTLPLLHKLTFMGSSRPLVLDGLTALTALQELYLGRVQLTRPGDLTALCTLRSLSLCHNRQLGDADLTPLTQLTRLDLWNNTRISDAALRGMTRLLGLDLTANDRITEAALYGLPQLRTLALSGSVDIGCGPLLRMAQLESLSYTECITIVPREMARLTQLTHLDLYRAMEPLQSLQWLVQLTRLRWLCLCTRERVTSRWVLAMPRLTRLHLPRRTPMTKRARLLIEARGGCVHRIANYVWPDGEAAEEEDD